MGAVGHAVVTELGPCPEIMPGGGTVVTGTFCHQADADSGVVHLKLEGQRDPTGVSTTHPYWSVDRQAFVEVGGLRVGELVNTQAGPRRVEAVTPIEHNGYLYNLETTEHVYRVGSLGTLVHNSCFNRGGSYSRLHRLKGAGEVPHHMPQNAAGVVSRGRGPALGMTASDHKLTRTFAGRGRVANAVDIGLTPMERLQLDVSDIRRLFGNKYDKGIEEMLDYARTLAEFQ
jgi:hypothetical protein